MAEANSLGLPPLISGGNTTFAWYHVEKTGLQFRQDWNSACDWHNRSFLQLYPGKYRYQHMRLLLIVVRQPYLHTRSVWHHTCLTAGCVPFAEWVEAFAERFRMNKSYIRKQGLTRIPSWGGPPINYQSRYLEHKLHRQSHFAPDPGEAHHMVNRSAYLTGITELMHESLCIFHGLLWIEETNSGRAPTLPTGCDCRDAQAWNLFSISHDDSGNSHHVNHSADASLLTNEQTLATIDEMTERDRKIFALAAQQLLTKAHTVETYTGVRIFCGKSKDLAEDWARGSKRLP